MVTSDKRTRGQRLAAGILKDLVDNFPPHTTPNSMVEKYKVRPLTKWLNGETPNPSRVAVAGWARALNRTVIDLEAWMGDEEAIGHKPTRRHTTVDAAIMDSPVFRDLNDAQKRLAAETLTAQLRAAGSKNRVVVPDVKP